MSRSVACSDTLAALLTRSTVWFTCTVCVHIVNRQAIFDRNFWMDKDTHQPKKVNKGVKRTIWWSNVKAYWQQRAEEEAEVVRAGEPSATRTTVIEVSAGEPRATPFIEAIDDGDLEPAPTPAPAPAPAVPAIVDAPPPRRLTQEQILERRAAWSAWAADLDMGWDSAPTTYSASPAFWSAPQQPPASTAAASSSAAMPSTDPPLPPPAEPEHEDCFSETRCCKVQASC